MTLGWEYPLERRMATYFSVFFPGEFHGQRSLVSYSPWGHKELDMTEWLTLRSQTLQEQLSLWLGHVNPEATSQHHPS